MTLSNDKFQKIATLAYVFYSVLPTSPADKLLSATSVAKSAFNPEQAILIFLCYGSIKIGITV